MKKKTLLLMLFLMKRRKCVEKEGARAEGESWGLALKVLHRSLEVLVRAGFNPRRARLAPLGLVGVSIC